MAAALRAQFFPLLDLRVDFLLLFASFLTTASSPDDPSGFACLDLLLVAGFLGAGSSSLDNSADFDRLDPLFIVSFASSDSSSPSSPPSSSPDDSLYTGRLAPLLVIFFTSGVLGFFAGAPLLTGVDLDGVCADFFLEAVFFLADIIAEETAFLAGDFFDGRPLPLAFDWLALRDFLAGGGRRTLGGGLFFLEVN